MTWIERLVLILESWRGTPYMKGQQCKGVGVDCVRFVCAVLDELDGQKRSAVTNWPQDGGWHNRTGALRIARLMLERYAPASSVLGLPPEPADVLILGPPAGGPAHVMIAGGRPGDFWHADHGLGVQVSSIVPSMKVFHAYRAGERERWSF